MTKQEIADMLMHDAQWWDCPMGEYNHPKVFWDDDDNVTAPYWCEEAKKNDAYGQHVLFALFIREAILSEEE